MYNAENIGHKGSPCKWWMSEMSNMFTLIRGSYILVRNGFLQKLLVLNTLLGPVQCGIFKASQVSHIGSKVLGMA